MTHPEPRAIRAATGGVKVIGCVLHRGTELIGREPFYVSVMQGLKEVASAHENDLVLLRVTGAGPGEDLDVYRWWKEDHLVDGVVLFDLLFDDVRPRLLRSLDLPFVIHGVLHGETAQAATFESQASDAALVVEHFAQLGHTTIAHVTGPFSIAHEVHRNARVVTEARVRGLDVVTLEGDYTVEGGRRCGLSLWQRRPDVTAVIASNDLLAIGVHGAARYLGRAPSTAIVSWDDSDLCVAPELTLTALDRRTIDTGRRSARSLLHLMDGVAMEPDDVTPVTSTLKVRSTSIAR